MNKNILKGVGIVLLSALISLLVATQIPKNQTVGGTFHPVQEDFSGGISVNGTTVITTAGAWAGSGTLFTSPATLTDTLTVGEDDTGHDVTFFGATSGKSFLWDESADKAIITGDASVSGTTTLATVNTTNDVQISGTTPLLTIGDGGDEDTGVQINSDTNDYYIASENSADTLILGLGSAIGTTPIITLNSSQLTTLAAGLTVTTGAITATAGDLILTAGRIDGTVDGTPTNCGSNAVTLDLSAATNLGQTIQADQVSGACAVTLSNGVAGEVVTLDLIYGGDTAWTFAAGGAYIGDTFAEANCPGFQATAADGDHLIVTGIMFDADTIIPTGCYYADQ